MRTLKAEVKTFYTIELDTADFANIIEQHRRDVDRRAPIIYSTQKAFDWFTLNDSLDDTATEKIIKQMHGNAHGDTFTYIANYYGFDGWENGGYWNEQKKIYKMTVYNIGDTLN